MDATLVWAIILALAAATFVTRLSFIGLLAHIDLPHWMLRALAYMPPAIFAAIIAPQVFPSLNALPTLDWPRLVAALLAGAVAKRTRNISASICSGMLTLWSMQALLG